MAPTASMPLRGNNPESHVVAAAAAQESTLKILKATRPEPVQDSREPRTSFIEDVDGWIRKYLNLADEVLQAPSETDSVAEKDPAA